MRDENAEFWDDIEADYDRKRAALDAGIRAEIRRMVVSYAIIGVLILVLWACGVFR